MTDQSEQYLKHHSLFMFLLQFHSYLFLLAAAVLVSVPACFMPELDGAVGVSLRALLFVLLLFAFAGAAYRVLGDLSDAVGRDEQWKGD